MGQAYGAMCDDCGKEFEVKEGGGFAFHLLRCEKCGKSKDIGFDEIGEPHLRYLKGLNGPYAIATMEVDNHVQENYPGEPLSEEEYHQAIEEMVKKCRCGGRFSFDAPPRCPKCRSLNFTAGGITLMYD